MQKILLLLLACSLGVVAGCKKKQSTEAAAAEAGAAVPGATEATPAPAAAEKAPDAQPQAAEALPGVAVIRADLKNKNYDKVVEALLVLRGYANTHNQVWAEFREFSGEVGQGLAAAAETDANATRALAAYNMAMYGR